MENNKKRKTLIVLTGFSCNNKCIMCSIEKQQCAFPNRSFSDIEADIKIGSISGYKEIEFTGGEPTIRKDIIDIIACANKFGYEKISLSTNGRIFSYSEKCDKFIEAGLNKVTISLLGPDAETHNAITRTPNSFSESVEGIKNLQKQKNFQVNVSSVVSSMNYEKLIELGKLILSWGIKNWYLLDLIPEGEAEKHYAQLAVTQNELSKKLNELNTLADKFGELGFFDFTYCLFSPQMRDNKKINFVNTQARGETTSQVGYDPQRLKMSNNGLYQDELRRQVEICRRCRFNNLCGGVWHKYLDKFGEEETNQLAQKNDCLD
jgi:cyclic pyranopterin phosphate synthase